MIDAVSEFLTANRQRRYPFSENTSLLDISETFELPNDLLLDYRGFHRARNELKPRLAAIVGPTAAADVTYPETAGFVNFYFEMGREDVPIRMLVQINILSALDLHDLSATSPDPFYEGLNLASMHVTIGAAWRDIGSSDRWVFAMDTAVLEPALTVESYRNQIDYVKLIHQDADSEYLQGDITLYGGYNVTIGKRGDNRIFISAELGAGELGRFTGQLRDGTLEFCDGSVMFLNGVGPNEKGEFIFAEGNGIKVINLPDQNKIQIQVAPEALQRPLC